MVAEEPNLEELEEYVRATAKDCEGRGYMDSCDPKRPFRVVMREPPPYEPPSGGWPDERFFGVDGRSASAFIDFDNRELVVSPALVGAYYKANATTWLGLDNLHGFILHASKQFFGLTGHLFEYEEEDD